MNTRRLSILHSNDMHGDFIGEVCGAQVTMIGGLSLLSGYINQVRRADENVRILHVDGCDILVIGVITEK